MRKIKDPYTTFVGTPAGSDYEREHETFEEALIRYKELRQKYPNWFPMMFGPHADDEWDGLTDNQRERVDEV